MASQNPGEHPIASNRTYTNCVILEKNAFDPEQVFHDDIVDDDVLPSLSLSVDGLTQTHRFSKEALEHERHVLAAEQSGATGLPDCEYDPEQLEVYGWETSFWRKVLSYFRF